MFFLFLIPPIIFESGYSLHADFFMHNLGMILNYAIFGTALNTFIIAFALWGASAVFPVTGAIPLVDCLLFASLISAVDPVAVIAIFEVVHVNHTLHALVFGESVINDAVSIVLYHLFLSLRQHPAVEVSAELVFSMLGKFAVVSLGGLAIGLLAGALCSFTTRFTQHLPVVDPLLMLLHGYLAYVVSETLSLSGIVAVLFCGMTVARYTTGNITTHSVVTSRSLFKMFASTAETMIFFQLGLAIPSLIWRGENDPRVDGALFGVTIALCLVVRFLVVFALSFLGNRGRHRLERVSFKDQLVLAYSGLRGAIAFALAFGLPTATQATAALAAGITGTSTYPAALRRHFVDTTLLVILFTVFVQGGTVKWLVRLLHTPLARNAKFGQEILIRPLGSVMQCVHWMYHGRSLFHRASRRVDRVLRRILMRRVLTPEEEELRRSIHTLHEMREAEEMDECDRIKREGLLKRVALLVHHPNVNLNRVQSHARDPSPSPSPSPCPRRSRSSSLSDIRGPPPRLVRRGSAPPAPSGFYEFELQPHNAPPLEPTMVVGAGLPPPASESGPDAAPPSPSTPAEGAAAQAFWRSTTNELLNTFITSVNHSIERRPTMRGRLPLHQTATHRFAKMRRASISYPRGHPARKEYAHRLQLASLRDRELESHMQRPSGLARRHIQSAYIHASRHLRGSPPPPPSGPPPCRLLCVPPQPPPFPPPPLAQMHRGEFVLPDADELMPVNETPHHGNSNDIAPTDAFPSEPMLEEPPP
eukprot:gnl/Trimastix_PCT/2262.p1 GENE.gnl/Trimastix_PCT/2262~~gnl/Trimastix_PCT/2262.p1  ORF type:complete len:760 (+),score=224.98 gnl/Trimastix_PCT/2262:354-2633(+)